MFHENNVVNSLLWAQQRWIRGKLFGGRGAQSNLFVHTPAEPDQNNWYIRTGFREQIWQPEREREQDEGVGKDYILHRRAPRVHLPHRPLHNMEQRNCFILPLINIILSLWLLVAFLAAGILCCTHAKRLIWRSEINERAHFQNTVCCNVHILQVRQEIRTCARGEISSYHSGQRIRTAVISHPVAW